MWISDAKTEGTVKSKHHSPRSYWVSGPLGALRRNRLLLVPMPASDSQSEAPQETLPETASPAKDQNAAGIMRTRSGREVKKPHRLDL